MPIDNLLNIRSRSNKSCEEQQQVSSGYLDEPLSTVLEFKAKASVLEVELTYATVLHLSFVKLGIDLKYKHMRTWHKF
jgi:hypothetical protein